MCDRWLMMKVVEGRGEWRESLDSQVFYISLNSVIILRSFCEFFLLLKMNREKWEYWDWRLLKRNGDDLRGYGDWLKVGEEDEELWSWFGERYWRWRLTILLEVLAVREIFVEKRELREKMEVVNEGGGDSRQRRFIPVCYRFFLLPFLLIFLLWLFSPNFCYRVFCYPFLFPEWMKDWRVDGKFCSVFSYMASLLVPFFFADFSWLVVSSVAFGSKRFSYVQGLVFFAGPFDED